MRVGAAFLIVLAGVGETQPGDRYGVAPDLAAFPQDSPKAALASVLKAADAGRFDYLAAQLADPDFIEARVKERFAGRFADQVRDVRARLDPFALKQLHRFLDDGEWTADGDHAAARLKDRTDLIVSFRKIGGRWFMEHPSRPKD